MKTLTVILMSIVTSIVFAQSPVNEIYDVPRGNSISLKFDYPELIKIRTWDRNEILITGNVNINDGEHDNKFNLVKSNQGDMVILEGKIPDIKELPERITAIDGKDTMTFKSREEFRLYSEKNNRKFSTFTMGARIKIQLEVKVPKNIATQVESTYGMVEVKDFQGSIAVQAMYGGIDASVWAKSIGELIAETNHGKIYSDLDLKFTGSDFKDSTPLLQPLLGKVQNIDLNQNLAIYT